MTDIQFTDKAYLVLGYHKCPDCGAWFKPLVARQIYCVRCEEHPPVHNEHWKENSRASLIQAGLETYNT